MEEQLVAPASCDVVAAQVLRTGPGIHRGGLGLCTPQGVVDLRTGLMTPPDPNKDFHSRSTTAAPQQMPTPRWMRFLTGTFGDDTEGLEMIDYLHLRLGYSITGDVGA